MIKITLIKLFHLFINFKKSKSGFLILSSGSYNLQIITDWEPKYIYLYKEDINTMHNCCGFNYSDKIHVARKLKNGFILKCDIKNEYREIKWLAIKK